MTKNIFATLMVATVLVTFTHCSEDDVIADSNDQKTRALQAREQENTNGRTKGKSIPTEITGTINGIAFTGDYRISKFITENDVLYAVGTLTNISGVDLPAAVSDLAGQIIKLPVEFPQANTRADASAAAVGSCDILFLQLGPLDLDLLGLQVHLDQVLLNIDAATGSGNLLGNLLCAITGLLDGVGSLVVISQLLNQIISIIGTIG